MTGTITPSVDEVEPVIAGVDLIIRALVRARAGRLRSVMPSVWSAPPAVAASMTVVLARLVADLSALEKHDLSAAPVVPGTGRNAFWSVVSAVDAGEDPTELVNAFPDQTRRAAAARGVEAVVTIAASAPAVRQRIARLSELIRTMKVARAELDLARHGAVAERGVTR